jgi:hypothetical protein
MTVEYRTTGILGKLLVWRPIPRIALQPAIFSLPLGSADFEHRHGAAFMALAISIHLIRKSLPVELVPVSGKEDTV